MDLSGLLFVAVALIAYCGRISSTEHTSTEHTNTRLYNITSDRNGKQFPANEMLKPSVLKLSGQSTNMSYTNTNDSRCRLRVTKESKKEFTNEILTNHYNFVYLRLDFENFTVNETEKVIDPTHWVWTYKGKNGAQQYLFLPGDFGYLSFGILWSHARVRELRLKLGIQSGECSNLTIGEPETDQIIGNALGKMTAGIAQHDNKYNYSYWCYNERVWLWSESAYTACKYSVCTLQTFEYKCCMYNTGKIDKKRRVDCSHRDFHFGELWWILPIIMGKLCFAFYPLLLIKFGRSIRKFKRRMAWNKNTSSNTTYSTQGIGTYSATDVYRKQQQCDHNSKRRYINLKCANPVAFTSTIFSPIINCCDFDGQIFSRIIRILVIFLPMGLSSIRVFLDYTFARTLVIEAVRKDALVGFSSIIAGFEESRKRFLIGLGGPAVAIAMYVVFGCILISIPKHFEQMLEKGMFKGSRNNRFILTMHIKQKETLGRVFVSEFSGYKKIHNYLLVQTHMLLNWRFWKLTVLFLVYRWKRGIFSMLKRILRVSGFAYLLGLLILPVYISFSILELMCSSIYFAFPVISCFFLFLRAQSIHYTNNFSKRSALSKVVIMVLVVWMMMAFCVFWYMFCILFFDGFWFLSKIAMFSYSGIIAYPKWSYGYLILAFMAVYYLIESINNFGTSYKELLIVSIEACEKIQIKSRHGDSEQIKIIHNNGIPIDLYHVIVERHLPRRVQVLTTLLKFVFVVSVLTISIELLITFNNIQELSLISHVFTVLFICALPKIVRVMCVDGNQYKNRKRLRKTIQRTIYKYLSKNGDTDMESNYRLFIQ